MPMWSSCEPNHILVRPTIHKDPRNSIHLSFLWYRSGCIISGGCGQDLSWNISYCTWQRFGGEIERMSQIFGAREDPSTITINHQSHHGVLYQLSTSTLHYRWCYPHLHFRWHLAWASVPPVNLAELIVLAFISSTGMTVFLTLWEGRFHNHVTSMLTTSMTPLASPQSTRTNLNCCHQMRNWKSCNLLNLIFQHRL